jgi:DNA-binding transcriptional LysR family regulator
MGVTDGAISRHIRNLEQVLGFALFVREHNRVRLTGEGEALAGVIIDSFARMNGAVDKLRTDRERRSIVIGAPATFLLRWLIPKLPELQALIEDVSIQLTRWDKPADLSETTVDIFIVIGEEPELKGARTTWLMPERFGLVVNPFHLANVERTDWASHLSTITGLVPRTRPHILDEWLTEAHAALSIDKRTTYEQFYFALQACEAGLGVTIGPFPLVEDALNEGRLVAPFGFSTRSGAFYAVSRADQSRAAPLSLALDWLRDATLSCHASHGPGQYGASLVADASLDVD